MFLKLLDGRLDGRRKLIKSVVRFSLLLFLLLYLKLVFQIRELLTRINHLSISYQVIDVLGIACAEGEVSGTALSLDVQMLANVLNYLRAAAVPGFIFGMIDV
jgi:hypothetical protein